MLSSSQTYLNIKAPSSKSISHRMLMGAALAKGTSTVSRVLMSKDIERTCAVLSLAGAHIEKHNEHSFTIQGLNGKPRGSALNSIEPALSCYVHESGTSCRLLTAILAMGQGRFRIHGAPRLHERPMGSLAQALSSLGVHISYEGKEQCPPFTLTTSGYQKSHVHIDLDESSQYLSGLLLAAPCTANGLTIYLEGKKTLSWPYVALTLQAMEDFGICFNVQERHEEGWRDVSWRSLTRITPGALRFCVPPGQYTAADYAVEGDWSGASYFLAAAAVGKKPLRITGLRKNSLQGDKAMLDILIAMHAKTQWDGEDLLIEPAALHGVRVDMSLCPDIVPTVAIVAAFASGSTTIYNVPHLRIKESDRIAAPADILRQVGVKVEEHDDGLTIHGLGTAPIVRENTLFSSHNDHRIAMSAALLGLHSGQGITIDDNTVVQKSFPHFWQLWETLL